MNKSKVATVRISGYIEKELQFGLKRGLALLGGITHIIPPLSKVFVKINHSSPSSPEKGIITHPALTKQILILLKEIASEIVVGDDVDAGDYEISGYRAICNELGVALVSLREGGFKRFNIQQGSRLSEIFIPTYVQESDFIINVPKLKTHVFTLYTGCIKNIFGIMPQGFRTKMHYDNVEDECFSQALVDIFASCRPNLNIMDAIVSMEGEGPAAGNLRNTNLLLISQDGVALDTIAAKILGMEPLEVLTTRFAAQRSLGEADLHKIEVVGEDINENAVHNFKLPTSSFVLLRKKMPAFLYRFLRAQKFIQPAIVVERCQKCLVCLERCPAKAIKLKRGYPCIDNNSCIHCMCCYEVCRHYAINLRKRFLGRLVTLVSGVLHRLKLPHPK